MLSMKRALTLVLEGAHRSTGLPNQQATRDELNQAIEQVRQLACDLYDGGSMLDSFSRPYNQEIRQQLDRS